MRRAGGYALALSLLVGGCIPPSAPPQGANAPRGESTGPMDVASGEDPYLTPRYEDVLDQPAVWEMRPVVANARAVSEGEHIVAAGETLSAISVKTGASVTAIADENGLTPPYTIEIGQRLRIPSGRFHRVATGETGIAIARAYGIRWSELVAANNLQEPFVLKVGQGLRIPVSANALPPALPSAPGDPLENRAAAFKLDLEDILTGGEPATPTESVAVEAPTPSRPLPATTPVREPSQFTSGFGWPVAGRVVSRFGPASEGQVNQGIEIRTTASATVSAAGDGVVAFVGDDVVGYGGMILIRHGNGWISAYGRVATAKVQRGQKVKRGDPIGTTGSGTTPQLHFQLRKQQAPVDPLKRLPPRA